MQSAKKRKTGRELRNRYLRTSFLRDDSFEVRQILQRVQRSEGKGCLGLYSRGQELQNDGFQHRKRETVR